MLRITASPAVALGILVMNADRLPDQILFPTTRQAPRGGCTLPDGICPEL